MTYRGHVRNGVVVLANGATLPDGAEVRVELVESGMSQDGVSLYDRYKPFIGILDNLPEDLAAQHDHYIHGTPRK
jgi:hypothetical protein